MKLRETKKLHYNKYLYKLSIPSQLAGYFRTEFQKNGKLGYARERLDVLSNIKPSTGGVLILPWAGGSRFVDRIPVEHYYDAIDIYRHLKNKENYIVRCGTYDLSIYSNDRKLLIDLSNKLRHRFIEFWEPDPENIDKLLTNENENIILVNKPPEYEYKVTLGKVKGSPSLASWIDANPKLGKMGWIAKEECRNNGWVKGYYFYVRDQKTLLIAQMLVGDNIQRIDKLVYSD